MINETSGLRYNEVEFESVKELICKRSILIVTATDTETRALHEKITPLSAYGKILKIYEGELTYYVGVLGNYVVAHVQSSMGAMARDSSIMTVNAAIDKISSPVVIMVGIAFGVDDQKQNIGDVLVSESVIPYNSKRVGIDKSISRGVEAPSSKTLFNRFKSINLTWEHLLPGNVKAKLIPTRMLSGEELIDNKEHRDQLLRSYPDSRGGEMEGAGIFAACDGKADWIIVKGICDFADGEKGEEKKQKQEVAIFAAISACMEVLNSNSAFKKLGVNPIEHFETKPPSQLVCFNSNVNDCLFDVYDLGKESYYIERAYDKRFSNVVDKLGVWVYGATGCGKSNLILRNLIVNEQNFHQISLAACIGQGVDQFFEEILFDLVSNTKGTTYFEKPRGFNECHRAILTELKKKYESKNFILFIEEIPISTNEDYSEFVGKVASLLTAKSLNPSLENVRFVLSSINNPTIYLKPFQQKIHEQLTFVELKYWENTEIHKLINIIETEIKFSLSAGLKAKLIEKANGSPRFIKKFYRSLCTLGVVGDDTITYIIDDTSRDLSQK